MKRTSATLNLSHIRRTFQSIGAVGRTFVLLSTASLLFFMLLGIGTYLQAKELTTSPVSSMKGLAASVSNVFFMDMLGMEVPHLNSKSQKFTFSQQNIFHFAFQMVTDINPQDPKSLVASEVPGMKMNNTTVLRSSKADNPSEPVDLVPAPEAVQTNNGSTNPEPDPAPGSNGQTDPQPLTPDSSAAPTPAPASKPLKTAGNNVAFVYQTHSNESYLPELKGITEPDEAYSDKINVIQVGKRLAENLEKVGIGAVHSNTVYPNVVKGFKYPFSYKYSRTTLQEAMAAHPDLNYYFDIHRDSSVRKRTTVTIDNKDYAQVYFIIGGKNPDWKKNEEFANKIHQILEEKHPGISKGIHAKTETEGNGLYNQNMSPNNILIEIGGPYNTLEECYRTTDWLADAISEVILNAKKVNAPVTAGK
ncbi:stage II sporulation protein P [Paenibacillus eucommiae]|uniref:Stage II sporulation protein P n=1 Tax=Paenibacillus eucommiae TaxID=1355755 RepID=A0ABS4IZ67_9BACL|nr:stage II sporulation protein P [Paenibacillus eucommiae]MBP1992884.1 stage II sporulation protein P [Paenibacillus eucommiae]